MRRASDGAPLWGCGHSLPHVVLRARPPPATTTVCSPQSPSTADCSARKRGGGAGALEPRGRPPKERWAIARGHKGQSAQKRRKKMARQWPKRPDVPFRHNKGAPVGGTPTVAKQ